MDARPKKRSLELDDILADHDAEADAEAMLKDSVKKLGSITSEVIGTLRSSRLITQDMVLLWLISNVGSYNLFLMKELLYRVPEGFCSIRYEIISEIFEMLKEPLSCATSPSVLLAIFEKHCRQFLENTADMTQLLKVSSFSAACTKFGIVHFLAPPSDTCCLCLQRLTLHNKPIPVTVFTLNGPEPGVKLSLRCRKCEIAYNYNKYGSSSKGFQYYENQRKLVEASDVVYLESTLADLFAAFG